MDMVFVDTVTKKINVYTANGVEYLDFTEYEFLDEIIGNKAVLYVTDAVKTTSKDIVASLAEAFGESDVAETVNSKRYFLHSTSKGVMNIPLDDNNDKYLIFNSPSDCKFLDDKLYKLIQSSFNVQQMLKQNKIEIISEYEMKKLVRQSKKEEAAKLRRNKGKHVDSTSGITVEILDSNIKAEDAARGEHYSSSDGDADVIDLSNEKEGDTGLSEEEILSGKLA